MGYLVIGAEGTGTALGLFSNGTDTSTTNDTFELISGYKGQNTLIFLMLQIIQVKITFGFKTLQAMILTSGVMALRASDMQHQSE